MLRAELIALVCLTLPVPAAAQAVRQPITVHAGRLDQAILQLGRVTGVSIGVRDPALAGLKVRAVRGTMTPDEALRRLLAGSGMRARRVAPRTFLIERLAARIARKPARRPQPAPPERVPDAEIVVTASKRDVPIGAYPGGVQIVDGAELSEAEGMRGTDAVAARVASLASTHLGPGRNKLFIRGIADSSFVGPTQSTVGQYWSNSPISYSAPDPSLRLYDIGRVEVLEGPQGTLYGAGSLGGVLRVVPRAPELQDTEMRGWGGVQLVEHGDAGVDAGALVNVPLVAGTLGLRALAFASAEGGYIDDRQRGLRDVNRVRTLGGRAGLRWLTDGWTLDVSALGQRIDGDDAQYADKSGDGLSRASAFAQPFRNAYWLGEVVGRKRWDSLELTLAAAHSRQYVAETFEGLAIADPGLPVRPAFDATAAEFRQINRIRMSTWEARLADRGRDGTGWVLAFSGLRNLARVHRSLDAPTDPLTGVRNGVTELTLYGEGTVAAVRDVTLTAGGRLTYSRLSGDALGVDVMRAFRADPSARGTRSELRLLPSAAATWRPVPGVTLFGRFQQGFRPGGLAVRRNFIQRFDGDRLSTVEAGARVDHGNFELTTNLSWTWWNDIQADVIDGYGFPATANIGDGRVLSAGLSARLRPSTALELDASLYLNSSRVTEVFAILPLDIAPEAPRRLPNVADASGRLGAGYRTRIGGADVLASGYLRYIGRSTLGIGPLLGRVQGGYLDTGTELRIGGEKGALSIALTNLLDQRGNRFALGTPFLIREQEQVTPMRPRTIRIGVEVAF